MEIKQIQELIKLVSETGLTEVKLENGDFKISIRSKDYFKATGETQIVQMPAMSAPMPMPPSYPPAVSTPPAPPVSGGTQDKAPAPKAEPKTNYLEVRSPIVGTFYRSQSPEKPPFVKVGDSISAGNVVCIVEAMKLFNEIETEVSGTVVKVLIEDASPVEYDQVLFLVEPN